MTDTQIHYLNLLEEEGKMVLQRGVHTFESTTLEEYNLRKESNFKSWNEIDDDELYYPQELWEYYGNETIKFI